MKKLLASILTSAALTAPALADNHGGEEAVQYERSGLEVDYGFSQGINGGGPYLSLSYGFSGVFPYLSMQSFLSNNMIVDMETKKFKPTSSTFLSLGVKVPYQIYSIVEPYVKLGAVALQPDKELAEDTSVGAEVGFGASIGFTENYSFVVEQKMNIGLSRADLIKWEPEVFNGNFTSVGFQVYL